jgi:metal-responsive CopG/Arc/MetJ family transcriptional regulator
MKTAISIPDDIFSQVTRCADELGMSRSEFFTRAAERYVTYMEDKTLTRQINTALSVSGEDDTTDDVVAAGRRALAADGDDW